MIYEITFVIITLGIWITLYFKHKYQYWEKKGIPYVKPQAPFGNVQNRFKHKVQNTEMYKRYHEYFKSQGYKHGGLYIITSPVYLPVDLDLIKRMLTKDFSYFTEHGIYYDEEHDPLNGHLFFLSGQKWRHIRTKITPTFTSGKMKKMFQIVVDCGQQMKEYVDELVTANQPLDIKDILASFTTDVIGTCAFGIECNSFKQPHSDFREYGRKVFTTNFSRKMRFLLMMALPKLSKKIGMPMFEREITDFYFNAIKKIVTYREDNNVKRNDYLDILLELKNSPEGLTFEEVAAQMFGFILAGFETSSTALTFCLFELAQNPDVQEKLRCEIKDMLKKDEDNLNYDNLIHLSYMGQVIDESLRKYPPLPALARKSVKDYQIPGTDIILETGQRVFISTLALHYDPEIYPDPQKFDPERFNEENKAKRHPYAFMPFGEGPRMCLGMRFAVMQIRIGLVMILSNYNLSVSSKTEVPLKMDPNNFLMMPKDKVWLEADKIV